MSSYGTPLPARRTGPTQPPLSGPSLSHSPYPSSLRPSTFSLRPSSLPTTSLSLGSYTPTSALGTPSTSYRPPHNTPASAYLSRSNLGSTPSTSARRAGGAGVRNPFEQLSAPAFDDFVDGITASIRNVLAPPPKRVRKVKEPTPPAEPEEEQQGEEDVFGEVKRVDHATKEESILLSSSSVSPPPLSSPAKQPLFAPESVTDSRADSFSADEGDHDDAEGSYGSYDEDDQLRSDSIEPRSYVDQLAAFDRPAEGETKEWEHEDAEEEDGIDYEYKQQDDEEEGEELTTPPTPGKAAVEEIEIGSSSDEEEEEELDAEGEEEEEEEEEEQVKLPRPSQIVAAPRQARRQPDGVVAALVEYESEEDEEEEEGGEERESDGGMSVEEELDRQVASQRSRNSRSRSGEDVDAEGEEGEEWFGENPSERDLDVEMREEEEEEDERPRAQSRRLMSGLIDEDTVMVVGEDSDQSETLGSRIPYHLKGKGRAPTPPTPNSEPSHLPSSSLASSEEDYDGDGSSDFSSGSEAEHHWSRSKLHTYSLAKLQSIIDGLVEGIEEANNDGDEETERVGLEMLELVEQTFEARQAFEEVRREEREALEGRGGRGGEEGEEDGEEEDEEYDPEQFALEETERDDHEGQHQDREQDLSGWDHGNDGPLDNVNEPLSTPDQLAQEQIESIAAQLVAMEQNGILEPLQVDSTLSNSTTLADFASFYDQVAVDPSFAQQTEVLQEEEQQEVVTSKYFDSPASPPAQLDEEPTIASTPIDYVESPPSPPTAVETAPPAIEETLDLTSSSPPRSPPPPSSAFVAPASAPVLSAFAPPPTAQDFVSLGFDGDEDEEGDEEQDAPLLTFADYDQSEIATFDDYDDGEASAPASIDYDDAESTEATEEEAAPRPRGVRTAAGARRGRHEGAVLGVVGPPGGGGGGVEKLEEEDIEVMVLGSSDDEDKGEGEDQLVEDGDEEEEEGPSSEPLTYDSEDEISDAQPPLAQPSESPSSPPAIDNNASQRSPSPPRVKNVVEAGEWDPSTPIKFGEASARANEEISQFFVVDPDEEEEQEGEAFVPEEGEIEMVVEMEDDEEGGDAVQPSESVRGSSAALSERPAPSSPALSIRSVTPAPHHLDAIPEATSVLDAGDQEDAQEPITQVVEHTDDFFKLPEEDEEEDADMIVEMEHDAVGDSEALQPSDVQFVRGSSLAISERPGPSSPAYSIRSTTPAPIDTSLYSELEPIPDLNENDLETLLAPSSVDEANLRALLGQEYIDSTTIDPSAVASTDFAVPSYVQPETETEDVTPVLDLTEENEEGVVEQEVLAPVAESTTPQDPVTSTTPQDGVIAEEIEEDSQPLIVTAASEHSTSTPAEEQLAPPASTTPVEEPTQSLSTPVEEPATLINTDEEPPLPPFPAPQEDSTDAPPADVDAGSTTPVAEPPTALFVAPLFPPIEDPSSIMVTDEDGDLPPFPSSRDEQVGHTTSTEELLGHHPAVGAALVDKLHETQRSPQQSDSRPLVAHIDAEAVFSPDLVAQPYASTTPIEEPLETFSPLNEDDTHLTIVDDDAPFGSQDPSPHFANDYATETPPAATVEPVIRSTTPFDAPPPQIDAPAPVEVATAVVRSTTPLEEPPVVSEVPVRSTTPLAEPAPLETVEAVEAAPELEQAGGLNDDGDALQNIVEAIEANQAENVEELLESVAHEVEEEEPSPVVEESPAEGSTSDEQSDDMVVEEEVEALLRGTENSQGELEEDVIVAPSIDEAAAPPSEQATPAQEEVESTTTPADVDTALSLPDDDGPAAASQDLEPAPQETEIDEEEDAIVPLAVEESSEDELALKPLPPVSKPSRSRSTRQRSAKPVKPVVETPVPSIDEAKSPRRQSSRLPPRSPAPAPAPLAVEEAEPEPSQSQKRRSTRGQSKISEGSPESVKVTTLAPPPAESDSTPSTRRSTRHSSVVPAPAPAVVVAALKGKGKRARASDVSEPDVQPVTTPKRRRGTTAERQSPAPAPSPPPAPPALRHHTHSHSQVQQAGSSSKASKKASAASDEAHVPITRAHCPLLRLEVPSKSFPSLPPYLINMPSCALGSPLASETIAAFNIRNLGPVEDELVGRPLGGGGLAEGAAIDDEDQDALLIDDEDVREAVRRIAGVELWHEGAVEVLPREEPEGGRRVTRSSPNKLKRSAPAVEEGEEEKEGQTRGAKRR